MSDVYPNETRLRYVSAKKADDIQIFLTKLGKRVAFYGPPVWVESEKRWYFWFVPDDRAGDISSIRL